MTIERRVDRLGRFLAGAGFALALLGLSSSASALNILFMLDEKVTAEAEAVVKQVVREFNEGIKDDATMLVSFGSCWNIIGSSVGEKPCGGAGGCYGKSLSNHFPLRYSDVRQALAEQVCGSTAQADAGCKQPNHESTGHDIQTFRTGMWPNQAINPINQAVAPHSTASEIIINSVNARVLGFCGGSPNAQGSVCGSGFYGTGELRAPMDAQAAATKVQTVCNNHPEQCYWGMCTEANRSWCTAGEGKFMQHANFQYFEQFDSQMWFNWNGGSGPGLGCFSGADDAAVALHHELNEAIGLGSSCVDRGSSPDTCGSTPRMQDMFRYKGAHINASQRSWSVDDKDPVYFSTSNGHEALVYFNTNQSKQGTTITEARICRGNGKHFSDAWADSAADADASHCYGETCRGFDYGDWFSCPANYLARDQDALDQGHARNRLAWTALDVQGFTLTHPEHWEGFIAGHNAQSAICGNGLVEAGEQCDDGANNGELCCSVICDIEPDPLDLFNCPHPARPRQHSAAHFQIKAQRSNARCHLRFAAKTLRGDTSDASIICDHSFKKTTDRLSRRRGPYPAFGDLGPHIIENKNWTAAIVMATEAEPRSLNSRCGASLIRAISSHLRCEGKAQLRELWGRDVTRLRDRCDQRLERYMDRLEARYEGAASCTANFEANDIILTSREGFMGEIAFFEEVVEP